jgi:hypothetical protein
MGPGTVSASGHVIITRGSLEIIKGCTLTPGDAGELVYLISSCMMSVNPFCAASWATFNPSCRAQSVVVATHNESGGHIVENLLDARLRPWAPATVRVEGENVERLLEGLDIARFDRLPGSSSVKS